MAIVDVKVPQLSESVAEATLLQWKKKPGEAVALDEILIEIETDKVVLEVPAPSAGVDTAKPPQAMISMSRSIRSGSMGAGGEGSRERGALTARPAGKLPRRPPESKRGRPRGRDPAGGRMSSTFSPRLLCRKSTSPLTRVSKEVQGNVIVVSSS